MREMGRKEGQFMKINSPHTRRARIDMLPIIDVVFLLLVFFIYAMLSMAVHHGLPVALPTSTTAPLNRDNPMAITIAKDGTLFLEKEPISLADLAAELQKKTRETAEPGVLLFADKDITYQTLYGVIDQIKRAGIDRLSLQSERQQ